MTKHTLFTVLLIFTFVPTIALGAGAGTSCERNRVQCDEGLYCNGGTSGQCAACTYTPTVSNSATAPALLDSNGKNLYQQNSNDVGGWDFQSMDRCPWFVTCPPNYQLIKTENGYSCSQCETGFHNDTTEFYAKFRYSTVNDGNYIFYSYAPDSSVKGLAGFPFGISGSRFTPLDSTQTQIDGTNGIEICSPDVYNIEFYNDKIEYEDGTTIPASRISGISYKYDRTYDPVSLGFSINSEIKIDGKFTNYINDVLKDRFTILIKHAKDTRSTSISSDKKTITIPNFVEEWTLTSSIVHDSTVKIEMELEPKQYPVFIMAPNGEDPHGQNPLDSTKFNVKYAEFGKKLEISITDVHDLSNIMPGYTILTDKFEIYHCDWNHDLDGKYGSLKNCGTPKSTDTNIVTPPETNLQVNDGLTITQPAVVIVPIINECTPGYKCDEGTATPCPAGTYQDEMRQTSCKKCMTNTGGKYPHSDPASVDRDECYLNLTPGNYVPSAGNGSVQCPAGAYCDKEKRVYYNNNVDISGTCTANYYCPAGSTTPTTKNCNAETDGLYKYSDPGAGEIDDCYLDMKKDAPDGGKIVGRNSGLTDCPGGYYCPAVTKTTKVYYDTGSDNANNPIIYENWGECAFLKNTNGNEGSYPNSVKGSNSAAACYLTLQDGYYVENHNTGAKSCDSGNYCNNGGTNVYYYVPGETPDGTTTLTSQIPCPEGYPDSDGNRAAETNCYLTLLDGYYVGTAGAKQDQCPPGSYCTPPTNLKVHYGETTSIASCKTRTNTKYPESNAGSTSANQCYLKLAAGKYVPNATQGAISCPAGYACNFENTVVYYNRAVSDTTTTIIKLADPCNKGTYQDEAGQTTCKTCDSGFTPDDDNGYKKCGECPDGYPYIDEGEKTTRDNCYLELTNGYYVPVAGKGEIQCPADHYCVPPNDKKIYYTETTNDKIKCNTPYEFSEPGATNQGDCYLKLRRGHYVAGEKEDSIKCGIGYACPLPTKVPHDDFDDYLPIYYGDVSYNRVKCEGNTYSSTDIADTCKTCEAGNQIIQTKPLLADEWVNSDCTACKVGKYSTDGEECKSCPSGTYQDQTGKDHCISCNNVNSKVTESPNDGIFTTKTTENFGATERGQCYINPAVTLVDKIGTKQLSTIIGNVELHFIGNN